MKKAQNDLSTNIQQAVSDFQSIKTALSSKTSSELINVPTNEYQNIIYNLPTDSKNNTCLIGKITDKEKDGSTVVNSYNDEGRNPFNLKRYNDIFSLCHIDSDTDVSTLNALKTVLLQDENFLKYFSADNLLVGKNMCYYNKDEDGNFGGLRIIPNYPIYDNYGGIYFGSSTSPSKVAWGFACRGDRYQTSYPFGRNDCSFEDIQNTTVWTWDLKGEGFGIGFGNDPNLSMAIIRIESVVGTDKWFWLSPATAYSEYYMHDSVDNEIPIKKMNVNKTGYIDVVNYQGTYDALLPLRYAQIGEKYVHIDDYRITIEQWCAQHIYVQIMRSDNYAGYDRCCFEYYDSGERLHLRGISPSHKDLYTFPRACLYLIEEDI